LSRSYCVASAEEAKDAFIASEETGTAMVELAKYSAVETLRNGRQIEIRALRPEDRDDFVAAAHHISVQSLRRRFFTAKREFSENEISFFVNVDFDKHVALVGVLSKDGRSTIVGSARYVVVTPRSAEVAFAIIDQYQGQGIGTVLMRHLGAIARQAGLCELTAEVLAENAAMLRVFSSSGFPLTTEADRGVVHVTLFLSEQSHPAQPAWPPTTQ
jgi:RimJ/RimL family protein N-acetyltransferase